MKKITFISQHRQKHFDFFNQMNHPHFSITANIDITNLLPFLKAHGFSVTPSIVYLLSNIANEIKEFRWRIRGNKVYEHDIIHPSFSVYTEMADVFSFCRVEFDKKADKFIKNALVQTQKMKKEPSIKDDPERDDFLFLSSIPWVSFTGFQNAMQQHPSDSVPRFVWGKFFDQNDTIQMPLNVQVHHAVVDGRHVGQFFNRCQEAANDPSSFFS